MQNESKIKQVMIIVVSLLPLLTLTFCTASCVVRGLRPDNNPLRAMEDQYYNTSTSPSLPEDVRKRYKCSGAERLVEEYRNIGDTARAHDWENTRIRECRD